MLAPDTPADHKIIAYRNVISLGKYNRGPVELGHNVVPYFCSEPEIDLKNAEVAAQTEPGWACKGTGMLGCVLKTFFRFTDNPFKFRLQVLTLKKVLELFE